MSELRDMEPASTSNATQGLGGRNVVAAIGIDRYHYWQRLSNAVRDATSAAELFQQLGFEQVTAPLLDDQATGKAIQSLVTDDLRTLGAGRQPGAVLRRPRAHRSTTSAIDCT